MLKKLTISSKIPSAHLRYTSKDAKDDLFPWHAAAMRLRRRPELENFSGRAKGFGTPKVRLLFSQSRV